MRSNFHRDLTRLLSLTAMMVLLMPLQAQKDSGGKKEPQFYQGDGSEVLMWRLFYHDNFSGAAVKLRQLSMDSLPDEVNLRLIKDSSEFCFPMRNIRTSPYGWRASFNRAHRGVDILLRTGDPIHACFPGVVRIARTMGGYGNVVVIRHENGLETVYGHMSKILVKPRQIVKAGDVIGLGGSTGNSTGPHLHFEVRFQYEPFDPEWLLDFSNYTLRTRRLHLDKTYFGITIPKGNKPPVFKADKSIIKERPTRQQPREVYHTATKDDTLELIAMQHSTTVAELKRLNPDLKKVKAGMKVRVR